MVLAMCDVTTANLNITGESIVMNPYGHLPGRLYGLLPFTTCLVFLYLVLCAIWLIKCVNFKNELMSVHIIISLLLVLFLVDMLLRFLNLNSYNRLGTHVYSLTLLSIISGALTRSIARGLTLVVAMG